MAMKRKPTKLMIETLAKIAAGVNSWSVDQRTLRSLRARGYVRADRFEVTPLGTKLLDEALHD